MNGWGASKLVWMDALEKWPLTSFRNSTTIPQMSFPVVSSVCLQNMHTQILNLANMCPSESPINRSHTKLTTVCYNSKIMVNPKAPELNTPWDMQETGIYLT
jgi:hypothetical protein